MVEIFCLRRVGRIKTFELSYVDCVGKVPFDEVKNYYASHDVLVFPSLRDSVGVQLVEAMAYGLPIITLDLNGASLLVERDRGIKIPVKEETQVVLDFAKAIEELSENKTELKTMSKNAFEYSKGFIWEEKIKNITETYYPNFAS